MDGDFVYIDSPYYGVTDDYSKGFAEKDHYELKEWVG